MKLYKNVDICDLPSIRENGILDQGNLWYYLGIPSNWEEGKRAHNRTDVVYLFKPFENGANTFPAYGAALLEIDVPDEWVRENPISENDYNHGKYIEYVCDQPIPAGQIRMVYVPDIPDKFDASNLDGMPVAYCDIEADGWDGKPMGNEQITQFKKSVPSINSTGVYMYFRGQRENGEVFDLYNVRYVCKQ